MAKGYADPKSEQFVRAFRKAYRINFSFAIEGTRYNFTSGLITEVDFGKEYEFPVMYDPLEPTHFKMITELPKSIAKNLCLANGLSYQEN